MRSVCLDAGVVDAVASCFMRIVFRDVRLAAIRTAEAAQTGFPFAVIASCQRKLLILDAASDERTIRNWKSLRYEELNGRRSIRLDDQWRLLFEFDDSVSQPTVEIFAIENHTHAGDCR
jgi:proteic killer suppression protein